MSFNSFKMRFKPKPKSTVSRPQALKVDQLAQNLTMSLTKPHQHVPLNKDTAAWLNFWNNSNEKFCFHFSARSCDHISLYTDAAGVHVGFAAVLDTQCFAGQWYDDMTNAHIADKELLAIVVEMEFWGPKLKTHWILLLTAKAAAQKVIYSKSSKSTVVIKLVRRQDIVTLKHSVFFRSDIYLWKINLCIRPSVSFPIHFPIHNGFLENTGPTMLTSSP